MTNRIADSKKPAEYWQAQMAISKANENGDDKAEEAAVKASARILENLAKG